MTSVRASVSEAEWARFLQARDQDVAAAEEMLQVHLQWRAASLPIPEGQPRVGAGLPSWMFFHGKGIDDTPLFWINGAMYDPEAAAPEAYALAAAALIDERLPRESPEQCTVLLDVRGGQDWPNPQAYTLLSPIRTITRLLSDNLPERCRRVIIFPVPWGASTVWSAVKLFLDQRTADKVVLVSGPVSRGSPCPEALREFVTFEQVRPDQCDRYAALKEGG